MISNRKNKAVYKSALAVLLGCTLAGCNSKNEGNVTDNNTDKTVETDNDKENIVTFTCENDNAEVMSAEETKSLTEGQFINAKDCVKVPDALILEENNLVFMFVYTQEFSIENKIVTMKYLSDKNIRRSLIEYNGIPEDKVDEEMRTNHKSKLDGIQIFKIVDYTGVSTDDNLWYKMIEFDGEQLMAGKVISKEKIKELSGK